LGTFNQKDSRALGRVVAEAVRLGGIGFDTAPGYGTQLTLGSAIRATGCDRSAVFVSDKVDGIQVQESAEGGKSIVRQVLQVLAANRLAYYDAIYVHWPFLDYLDHAWAQLRELRDRGAARALGLCNVTPGHLTDLRDRGIIPDLVQNEVHPLCTDQELTSYCTEHGIPLVAYTPTARLSPPVAQSPALARMSQQHGASLTQVIHRWHIQRGRHVVFMTTKVGRVFENTHVDHFSLDEDDLRAIDQLNQNARMFLPSLGVTGY
jgi:diketogulonate reductase-like aldo/keto reductase